MKIENVKNYNQKLLAVLGTIGVIFLVVALVSFISIVIQEHLRSHYDNDVETGILSDAKIEELQKENKREQVISYETPKLIDTLNAIYIVPVSHITLNEREYIDDRLLSVVASSSEYYEKPDDRYSNQFYGSFNNIIIYNSNNDTKKKLFDGRVNFNDIQTEYFGSEIRLFIKASEKDTYKDGVINLKDFQSLYIYSFNQQTMKKIGMDGMDVYSYEFMNNGKDLLIRFGVDKNEDGQYVSHNEPTIIKKYNFENGQLTDLIDKELNSQLQKTLEGTQQ